MQITLKGRIPSKKNQKNIVFVNKRPIIVSSKQHNAWHKDASKQLVQQKVAQSMFPKVKEIYFKYFTPDKRKTDLSNKWESVADLLVDNYVIQDDSIACLPKIILEWGGLDRENPRALIKMIV